MNLIGDQKGIRERFSLQFARPSLGSHSFSFYFWFWCMAYGSLQNVMENNKLHQIHRTTGWIASKYSFGIDRRRYFYIPVFQLKSCLTQTCAIQRHSASSLNGWSRTQLFHRHYYCCKIAHLHLRRAHRSEHASLCRALQPSTVRMSVSTLCARHSLY